MASTESILTSALPQSHSLSESAAPIQQTSKDNECCIDFSAIFEKVKMVAIVVFATLGTLALCSLIPNFFFYGIVIGFVANSFIDGVVEKIEVFLEKSNMFVKVGLGIVAGICFFQATTTAGFFCAVYLGSRLASPDFHDQVNNFFERLIA